jgi:hypothetical protein
MKDPSRGPSAQSGFSAWKQSALFGFVSMKELKVHTLLHLLCHQLKEHKGTKSFLRGSLYNS